MIVYIVDLEMDAAITEQYLAWLRGHVREMLALPGFLDATIFRRLEPATSAGLDACAVHYRLRDRASYEDYLANHAATMRQRGLAAFGIRVRARRELLQPLK